MLEIIYDAQLLQFDFTKEPRFFGVKVSGNYGQTIESFSTTHRGIMGDLYVDQGPTVGHVHPHTERGFRSRAAWRSLEFIVPVIGEVEKYIAKLSEAEGIYLQGHFFETLSTFTTGPNQHVEHGRFRVPPDHFYFLGEHNVV